MKLFRIACRLVIAALVLLTSSFIAASRIVTQDRLPTGQIVPKVVSKSDPSKSYALYLPSNYTSSKKWPIIYGFDPGGRGLSAVEHFKDGAEKYGYIVVGSNDSRNGPNVPLKEIIVDLWQDTRSRFPIDDQQIYTAGFSGGARVACGVGYMFSGNIAGVIACGAGFPPAVSPSASTPFVLFGTAGLEDLNYFELKTLGHDLDTFSIPNRIATFDGVHQWAPPSLCTEAIEWIQLQAMKSGRRTRDEAMIDSIFNRELAKAKTDESTQKIYDTYVDYSTLVRDFKGLKDIASYEKKASDLRNTKEVKSALKDEDKEKKEQEDFERAFVELRNGIAAASDSTMDQRSMMQEFISNLRKQSEDQQNTSKRLIARRSLTSFSIMMSEQAAELMASKRYIDAATDLSIATLLQPTNARLSFNLARAYSLGKQKKEAIEALNKAVEKGFTDSNQLESNKDFDSIREDPQFKNLVATLKGKQK